MKKIVSVLLLFCMIMILFISCGSTKGISINEVKSIFEISDENYATEFKDGTITIVNNEKSSRYEIDNITCYGSENNINKIEVVYNTVDVLWSNDVKTYMDEAFAYGTEKLTLKKAGCIGAVLCVAKAVNYFDENNGKNVSMYTLADLFDSGSTYTINDDWSLTAISRGGEMPNILITVFQN